MDTAVWSLGTGERVAASGIRQQISVSPLEYAMHCTGGMCTNSSAAAPWASCPSFENEAPSRLCTG